jgi:CPA1 family monovalent cation:H+ antiporter
MTESAQDYLHRARDGIDSAHRERLDGYYRRRMHSFRRALEEVQVDFPDLYRRFETRLSLRAALAQAGCQVEEESRHGSISAKPATLIQRQIQRELRRVPSISMDLPDPQPRDLVALVPLFKGLPAASLIEVADRSKPVRFLTGDTIIGEDEHGDALYIVAQGRVSITRHTARGEECVVSERGVGDFFGETALLGDQVRTATVRATQSCTLLRLTRWDVLAIAEEHQAVAQRLQEARAARVKGDAERGMKVS